jgi:hypothetical protein
LNPEFYDIYAKVIFMEQVRFEYENAVREDSEKDKTFGEIDMEMPVEVRNYATMTRSLKNLSSL